MIACKSNVWEGFRNFLVNVYYEKVVHRLKKICTEVISIFISVFFPPKFVSFSRWLGAPRRCLCALDLYPQRCCWAAEAERGPCVLCTTFWVRVCLSCLFSSFYFLIPCLLCDNFSPTGKIFLEAAFCKICSIPSSSNYLIEWCPLCHNIWGYFKKFLGK